MHGNMIKITSDKKLAKEVKKCRMHTTRQNDFNLPVDLR